MLEIRTSFTPFKMKMSRKEPVTLSVEIANSGTGTEMVSMDLNLGNNFSMERSGFKSFTSMRMPEFKAGEKKKYYFDIWPKQMVRPGEHNILLAAAEHYQDFNYVKKKYDKRLLLSVEE